MNNFIPLLQQAENVHMFSTKLYMMSQRQFGDIDMILKKHDNGYFISPFVLPHTKYPNYLQSYFLDYDMESRPALSIHTYEMMNRVLLLNPTLRKRRRSDIDDDEEQLRRRLDEQKAKDEAERAREARLREERAIEERLERDKNKLETVVIEEEEEEEMMSTEQETRDGHFELTEPEMTDGHMETVEQETREGPITDKTVGDPETVEVITNGQEVETRNLTCNQCPLDTDMQEKRLLVEVDIAALDSKLRLVDSDDLKELSMLSQQKTILLERLLAYTADEKDKEIISSHLVKLRHRITALELQMTVNEKMNKFKQNGKGDPTSSDTTLSTTRSEKKKKKRKTAERGSTNGAGHGASTSAAGNDGSTSAAGNGGSMSAAGDGGSTSVTGNDRSTSTTS